MVAGYHHLLAGGLFGRDDFRRKFRRLQKHGQEFSFVDERRGRGDFEIALDLARDVLQAGDAEGHPDAPPTAECVNQHRHGGPFDVFKQQGFAALRTFGYAVGDLGDFQNRRNLFGDANQLPFGFQPRYKLF